MTYFYVFDVFCLWPLAAMDGDDLQGPLRSKAREGAWLSSRGWKTGLERLRCFVAYAISRVPFW